MRCAPIDRPTPRRARRVCAAWFGGLLLCAGATSAAEGVAPAKCPGATVLPAGHSIAQPPRVVKQGLPTGCARPAGRERSEAPGTPDQKRVPRMRYAPVKVPGGSIAPPDPRVLPA